MTLRALYVVAAAASLANAGWMLLDPASWYAHFPAGIPNTGPFNGHLIRDVGLAYGLAGVGAAWCAANVARSHPVHVGIAAFLVGHAAVHGADLAGGRLPPAHWLIDLPGVFVPALVLGVTAVPSVWHRLSPIPDQSVPPELQ